MVAIGRNRSQSVAIGRDLASCARFGRYWLRFGQPMVAIGRNRSQSVAKTRLPLVVLCRCPADCDALRRSMPCRLRRLASVDALPTTKARHKKSPSPFSRESGCACRYVSRVSMRRLIPRANRRASARSVLRGRARRWCIVMPTSDRRHIVRYISQNMRIHGQS